MNNEIKEFDVTQEIVGLLRSKLTKKQLKERLDDYHDNDIAGAFELLELSERKKLYKVLDPQRLADIFAYIEDVDDYFLELTIEQGAEVLSYMDSDDAVDVLEEMEEDVSDKLIELMDDEASEDVELIQSYEDDEVGSRMTTNFILIKKGLTVKQTMKALISQAQENDNIATIYIEDKDEKFYGVLDLKDLITAKEDTDLEPLMITSYPYLVDKDLISEKIEEIKSYSEDSIPVVNNEMKVIGILTAQDVVEAVDEEMGEDYAKLAGLTSEEDMQETTLESMKKRLPWLLALLVLGIVVSSVVGIFEAVVATLPIVMCFQSLILDMSGNVGTQSLAVTIRVLMDENLEKSEKFKLVLKEMKVGFSNGLVLGIISFIVIGLYLVLLKGQVASQAVLISGCVGTALLASMVISSLTGTLIPMIFHDLGIDPAVASGPLITTINDLVAVVSYYGLVWLLLIRMLHLG